MSDITHQRLTAAAFAQLPERNQPTELINGAMIVSPSPISQQQRLSRRLTRYLEDQIPDGEVFAAPLDLYLDEHNVLQPDVFWVAADSACQERGGYFYGPPALIAEILSPSTAKRDRGDKFVQYERHGVGEYWLIDPTGGYIEVWTRNETARFERVGVFGPGERFASPRLGRETDPKVILGDGA